MAAATVVGHNTTAQLKGGPEEQLRREIFQ